MIWRELFTLIVLSASESESEDESVNVISVTGTLENFFDIFLSSFTYKW
jgi:hypothetical protein